MKNLITLALFSILLLQTLYAHPASLLKKTKPEKDITLPIIGIDFGTHTTSMAYYNKGHLITIKDPQGKENIPSAVGFLPDGEMIFGNEALEYQKKEPQRVVYEINRVLGVKYDDVLFQEDLQYLLYNIVNVNDYPEIQIEIKGQKKNFLPEEIASFLLKNLINIAQKQLNTKINDCVISIPSYYNNAQRIAIKNAGFLANLEFTRLFSASGATALHHVYHHPLSQKNNTIIFKKFQNLHQKHVYDKVFAVYDIGASATEASLVTFNNTALNVKVPICDTHLGGIDIERQIFDQNSQNLEKNDSILQQKVALQHKIRDILVNNKEIDNLDFTDNKEIINIEEKIVWQLENMIIKSQNDFPHIDEILVKGSIAKRENIQKLLKEKFPGQNFVYLNDDQDVAKGTAIMGQQIYNKNQPKKPKQQQQQQQKEKQEQEQKKEVTKEEIPMLGGEQESKKTDL